MTNVLAITEAILGLQPDGEVWRFKVTGQTNDEASFAANVTWQGGAALTTWSAVSGALSAATDSVAMTALRAERDRLLAETDWWVLPDRTASAEQLAYRQALRDLPATTSDPADPVWPTKPEV